MDDRSTNRNILCRLARSLEAGTEAVAFDRPKAALTAMQSRLPDLIITDFNMPEMDGAEFVSRCRRELSDPEVPIIVITAYDDRDFRYRALEAGATDFLLSPIDHREFRTRTNNLLTIGRQRRIIRQRASLLERELDEALRRQAEVLRRGEMKLRRLIDSVPALIVTSNGAGRCLMANSFRNLLASGPDVTSGTIEGVLGTAYWQRHAPLDRRVLETGQTLPAFEEEMTDSFGRTRSFMTTKTPLFSDGGRIDAVVTVSVDIGDPKESENRFLQHANYDPVCGLPNRLIALDRLSQAMVLARHGGTEIAVLHIDLGGLKNAYEAVGHALGDRILLGAAKRISDHAGAADTVARLSGAAFLVILPGQGGDGALDGRIASIIDDLGHPFILDGTEFHVATSLGVSLFPKDGSSPEELVQQAQVAMQRAKTEGRGPRFFAPEMSGNTYVRTEMERLLSKALERDELHLLYQPIADIGTGRIDGMEALLRWKSHEFGPLLPEFFLPVAEETGLIVPIGLWVLKTACQQAAAWRKSLGRTIGITINLSHRQFLDADFPRQVADALAAADLSPEALELEMTERLLMGNARQVHAVLGQLRGMGVRLAIDDFGTDYASIMCLTRFPFNRLKIDRAFISEATESVGGGALVAAMLDVAKGLNLQTVGEGVETPAQLEFLRNHGCQSFQGFLLGRPAEAGDCEMRLRSRPETIAPSMDGSEFSPSSD
ncbi:EAL domain-containing protein [Telmatospirillum sp.]|uniref:EAL domain-containing response regulator n=1 Tax=Telmatospirillum sp. TaxID=2079197 RepID=UPI00284E9AFB|nr:EAL domain-containing protein [Telmatospirillum sp.]MDR3437187.1 EAL domain-containing protein [Telmatospirillum sp.]